MGTALRRALAVLGLAAATAAGAGAAGVGPSMAGSEKVAVCHKPGTPAEQEKEVPPSAVPGHLGHGDYLGPCGDGETTEETTTVEETTTTTEETTTEETAPAAPPCVPQNPDGSLGGKDGKPGNDDCAADEAPEQQAAIDEGPAETPAVPETAAPEAEEPAEDAPAPDAAPVTREEASDGTTVLVRKEPGGEILVKRPGDQGWSVAVPGSG